MKQDKLTESVIKEAKSGAKQFKLSDGGGLYLLVHSNGSKYWRFDFRFEGKQKSSSLGVWPEVSLVEARSRRNEAKLKIREGINPIQEKKKKSTQQHEQVWKKEIYKERSGPELQQLEQKPGQNGEIHITDAIRTLIYNKKKFIGHVFAGKYLDCGTMNGYINSSLEISKL